MKDKVAAFNEANGTTFEAEEFDDKSLDVAAAVPIYKTYIRRHGDNLAGFFGLGNFPTVAIIQAMKELGIGPGEYPLATIDTATVTNEGVKEGYVMFIYDNQYYTQSFIPAMQAWQYLERGFLALDRYPTGANRQPGQHRFGDRAGRRPCSRSGRSTESPTSSRRQAPGRRPPTLGRPAAVVKRVRPQTGARCSLPPALPDRMRPPATRPNPVTREPGQLPTETERECPPAAVPASR